MSVHFLYFLSKWRGVKPTSISNKYVENEISNSASLKKKEKKKRGAKTWSNFTNIISKTLKNLSLVTLVLIITNDHFYHLMSDPDENLKNKNRY